jgi:hypothetical protein
MPSILSVIGYLNALAGWSREDALQKHSGDCTILVNVMKDLNIGSFA